MNKEIKKATEQTTGGIKIVPVDSPELIELRAIRRLLEEMKKPRMRK